MRHHKYEMRDVPVKSSWIQMPTRCALAGSMSALGPAILDPARAAGGRLAWGDEWKEGALKDVCSSLISYTAPSRQGPGDGRMGSTSPLGSVRTSSYSDDQRYSRAAFVLCVSHADCFVIDAQSGMSRARLGAEVGVH